MANELFVIGHARSGTTVIADLLNSAPDVLLLYEAHMFEPHLPAQFVSNFNLHHRQAAVFKSKGKFLPSGLSGMAPEAILDRLGLGYQWIGEKVAVGPLSGSGAGAAVAALDYYLSHHAQAHYIVTFRAPLASLVSLRKVFPSVPAVSLLHGWMLSLIELAAAGHLFENAMLLPVEHLNMESWHRVQERLAIGGRAEAAWIGKSPGAPQGETRQALLAELATQMDWAPKAAAHYMDRLTALYDDFLACIDPDTMRYHTHTSFVARVGDQLLTEVHRLAAELRVCAAPEVPASVCAWSEKGELVHSRLANPAPAATFARYTRIVRDRLFSSRREQLLISHPGSPVALELDGVAMTRDGDWLRLDALPEGGRHKHVTAPLPIDPMRVATTRFLVQRERSARYLMVQSGDDVGFHNCVIDFQHLRVVSIVSFGMARNILAQVELLAGGLVRVLLSGMLAAGQGSYVRIYLCNGEGALEPIDAAVSVMLGDLVLSYGYHECGLGEVV